MTIGLMKIARLSSPAPNPFVDRTPVGIRVLVVDDVELWRRFATSALQKERDVQIIGEACDGLCAVQKATELQPDFILLDVGLPGLNGIQACARIRELSPESKILLMSVDRCKDTAMEGLLAGASGYLIKSDARAELVRAMRAVLDGKVFFSAAIGSQAEVLPGSSFPVHSVYFYDYDEALISYLRSVVVSSLEDGSSVLVVCTPEHRHQLQASLIESGITTAGLNKNRFQILDAKATLSEFMVDGRLSSEKFSRCVGQNIRRAKEAALNAESVTVFGEMVAILWSEGKQSAALELERLWNGLLLEGTFQLHCAYPRRILAEKTNSLAMKAICNEHSTILGFANEVDYAAAQS